MTAGEFLTLFAIGALMVTPQVIFQARKFLTSGSSDQVPFQASILICRSSCFIERRNRTM
ncbi:hypothetical protein D3870_21235 [Noviherbaspirillum cavernae]|uniref:Uncharacterized protein n=1 Tax=Noviherbaspirillum cavernae TaxID=2320862 RepID=A0A418WWJ0_9BURK|nr:hypothetical protein D3870_21235 [Noviherbaspirillum cavernae]